MEENARQARHYQLLEKAALENGSREAAAYLTAHGEEAKIYGINPARIALLGKKEN